ncbi:peroxisomal enoyl-CoA-hydratase [Trametes versicolor FP-101664 SS1]|uniref:peroxisomal enoyl-CoA-hydratase n=1 Tax=Trametes versicolor (strain FP-101664) TaxID=717944 RepID=UPI00046224F5|nr:peroxisomal enoyl-CoA-hydratase [Trametes versicolor FP-101664 SS1]EIW57639.1 peroxisomal enoyl-CoA-hydratase [Trametes versicolor FP-101664 SS1]
MSTPDYAKLGFTAIRVELDSSVAVVTLTRSKQRNTFSAELVDDLIKSFDLFDRDDRVRVVVLTAEPTSPAFCAGADISGGWGGLFNPEDQKEGEHAHRDTGGKVAMAIFRCRKITISAVNGHAVGVGVTGLQLPFDIRFVWAGARLAFPFVRRGIAPEACSSFLLPKLLGHSRALSLFLTGQTVTPDSPLISGLYHSILPTREEVFPAALALAKDLAANTSQTAAAVTKALVWHGYDTMEEQHIVDSRAIRVLGLSADAAEGALSFKERRAPKFADTLAKLAPWMPWWKEVSVAHRKSKL